MQSSWISCAKSGYSRTNLPLYKGGTPSGGILFLFVKKEYGERHAKEPMVLWKLLQYAAIAFALTYRC